MELKTKHIVNRELKSITFLLYGIIGEKVDGDYFAQELNWCARNYDTIIIRINSDGGNVTQGLSIVSEMVASPAEIITQIDGIAASMAAVIAICGDKVTMNDFAQIMIHEPYFVDNEGQRIDNAQLSAKDKRSIDRSKNQLVTILGRRGKSADDIATLLKKETWFNADEALQNGMVDEVINTGRKPELANLTPLKLVAQIASEIQDLNLNPIFDMKLIAKALGKPETSTEPELVDAINARETALATREKALQDREKKLVDRMIADGKATGTVTDANEPDMRELAEANFGLFEKMVNKTVAKAADGEGAGAEPVRLSDVLKAIKNQTTEPAETLAQKFVRLSKTNPNELARIEANEPEAFKKMYDAYEKQLV